MGGNLYTIDDLIKEDYFKEVNLEYVLDSLTGVIARPYILGFAKDLIKKNIKFSMSIMDIDNFKLVNDNYGHMAGDMCLKQLGEELVNFSKGRGFVGRFGGDEFIIIDLKSYDYDTAYQFLADMCTSHQIVRRTYKLGEIQTFVTGTTGCASFPKDANNYDDLFAKVDKALYRGKTKGRNCFIVYIEEKHANIDVHRREMTSLPLLFEAINGLCSTRKRRDSIIKDIVDYINDTLMLGNTFVVTVDDNKVISCEKKLPYYYEKDYVDCIYKTIGDKSIFVSSNLATLKEANPYASEYLTLKSIQSIIVARIETQDKFYGYLCLYENKIIRMWQENDVSLVMYVQKVLSMLYALDERKNKA